MNFTKNENESNEQYIYRICEHKDELGTWDDVAALLNKELGNKFGESAYRKMYQSYQRVFDTVGVKQIENGKLIDDMIEVKEDIIKEKVRLTDRKREYNKTLRDEARIEDIKKAVTNYVQILPKLDVKPYSKDKNGNEAILMLSDLHIGEEFKNFTNEYNLKIAQERVSKMVAKTLYQCKKNDVNTLHVCNLGDLITGGIHVNGRIESEFGTIEQVKQAAEILSQVLVEFDKNIPCVIYHSCTDNHARVFADKEEHIEKENFGKLIDWYVEARISGSGVKMVHDNPDDSFFAFSLRNGKLVVGAHGNLDRVSSVVQDYTMALGRVVSIVLLGHYHNEKQKNFQGAKVYINGSVVGIDQYAMSRRFFGNPEQTLLIFDGEDDIKVSLML